MSARLSLSCDALGTAVPHLTLPRRTNRPPTAAIWALRRDYRVWTFAILSVRLLDGNDTPGAHDPGRDRVAETPTSREPDQAAGKNAQPTGA